MALPTPSRRRGKLAAAATAARRVALLRAGFALFQTRLVRKLPGRRKPRLLTPARAAVVGGGLAAVAGFFRSRRSGGSGGSGGSQVGGTVPPPPPPPAPANYDAPGPPANSATPIPVPDTPTLDGVGIDEEAEIAAAAAEAANIGGTVPEYAPSTLDEELDPAEIPLAEGGGGISEGQEQAEGDLVDLVTTDIGPGAGVTDSERLIDETIERQSNPADGEVEELPPAPPGDR